VAQEVRRFRMAYFGRLMDDWPNRDCLEFARLLTKFTESVAGASADSG